MTAHHADHLVAERLEVGFRAEPMSPVDPVMATRMGPSVGPFESE
jgi:hypothetical protein